MNDETMLLLIIGGALALVVVIRIIAGTNTVVGKIFRWFWNIGFRIWSKFPLMGWMAHLIVAKTPAEIAMKARCISATDEVQDFYNVQIQAVAERQRQEQEREAEIRRVMSREGLDNVSIGADGNSATGTDKYGNTHHVNIRWK